MSFKEWSNKNKYNSFNSYKGLLYSDWYIGIANKELLTPIEAAIAPIHTCNLNCKHCNSGLYMQYGKEADRMTDDHLMKLVDFLGWWGVKGMCFAGSGEPTLHSKLPDAIKLTIDNGMCASILTNGTILYPELLEVIPSCTWVGVSVDAGADDTFQKIKGVNLFDTVIQNIEDMVKNSGDCDIGFKFLISSLNQYEIYDACHLSSKIGVHDFHVRPADFFHEGMKDRKRGELLSDIDIQNIFHQFEKCHELETDDFKVNTVMHKFNDDFSPKKDFSQCYGAPLSIPICADGKVYLCIDHWYEEKYAIGKHFPDPYDIIKFWGGEEHLKMIFGNTPEGCHTKCTFGVYSKQCEDLFINNKHPMHWKFP